jgi:hypothetical protein
VSAADAEAAAAQLAAVGDAAARALVAQREAAGVRTATFEREALRAAAQALRRSRRREAPPAPGAPAAPAACTRPAAAAAAAQLRAKAVAHRGEADADGVADGVAGRQRARAWRRQ